MQLDDGHGFRLQLIWPDLTAIEPADNRLAAPRASGGRSGTEPRSPGLVGWGRCEVPHAIPTWLREHLVGLPTDTGTGRMPVEIPLGAFDPRWWDGPMGAWVRRFRPDLTPPLPGGAQPPPGSRRPLDPHG